MSTTILKSSEVKQILATVKSRKGRPTSDTILAFNTLAVGQALKTNKSKAFQCRIRACKDGKKVSVTNLGNNTFLVVRTA